MSFSELLSLCFLCVFKRADAADSDLRLKPGVITCGGAVSVGDFHRLMALELDIIAEGEIERE